MNKEAYSFKVEHVHEVVARHVIRKGVSSHTEVDQSTGKKECREMHDDNDTVETEVLQDL